MFVGDATRLCPAGSLVVAPFEFDRYHEVSERVYSILVEFASGQGRGGPLPLLPESVDEAYLELADGGRGHAARDPEEVAADIRSRIRAATGCEASVGIGPNMLLAKLATRRAKPAGQFRLRPADVEGFLQDVPVRELKGVGWAKAPRLAELGARRGWHPHLISPFTHPISFYFALSLMRARGTSPALLQQASLCCAPCKAGALRIERAQECVQPAYCSLF